MVHLGDTPRNNLFMGIDTPCFDERGVRSSKHKKMTKERISFLTNIYYPLSERIQVWHNSLVCHGKFPKEEQWDEICLQARFRISLTIFSLVFVDMPTLVFSLQVFGCVLHSVFLFGLKDISFAYSSNVVQNGWALIIGWRICCSWKFYMRWMQLDFKHEDFFV